jgi:DtxR family Mn-dependent transcriptional regulator
MLGKLWGQSNIKETRRAMSATTLILIAIFTLLLIGWFLPKLRGLSRSWYLSRSEERILVEDALKHLYKSRLEDPFPSVQSLGGQLNITVDQAAEILAKLQNRGLVEQRAGSFRLTSAGRDYALHLIRAHRLWERYLADMTGVAEVEWHGRAERLEHQISPEQADELWAQLGHPTHDPHGDPVPTSKGSVASLGGFSLLTAKPGLHARVIHVEDEPETVYAQLVDQGIHPGMEIRVLESRSDEVQVLIEGTEETISALAAANVTVEPLLEEKTDFESTSRLSDLQPGERCRVVMLSRGSRATERRRLMDLGILPGTMIAAELSAVSGDPVAYRVRGALLALRRVQAEQIVVNRLEDNAA